MTLSEHEQRLLDQQSGAAMDRKGVPVKAITPYMASVPLTKLRDYERLAEMVIQKDEGNVVRWDEMVELAWSLRK